MLVEHTLDGIVDKVADAIALLRASQPKDAPYWLGFSGGKDSVVLFDLAKRAGVQFEAHYSLTTVDPPELVQFIRREYPEVAIDRPKQTMWQLVVAHSLPPTATMRYCCRELKECRNPRNRTVLTGIRWQESVSRRGRRQVEACLKGNGVWYIHPIIAWTESEVWEYIRTYGVRYCPLYDEGFKRLGCVMCPQASVWLRKKQAARWPKLALAWKRACVKAWEKRKARGDEMTWQSGEELYEWWMSRSPGQSKESALFD